MQKVFVDDHATQRFTPNQIVVAMLDAARRVGFDLNAIAHMPFSREDRQQFAQLLGYSLSGYSELPYVDDVAMEAVDAIVDDPKLSYDEAVAKSATDKLNSFRDNARVAIAALYEIHPDDLVVKR
jgi:hypothetical protein